MKASTLAALASALTVAAPAGAANRNFGITDFDRIRVDGPYKVLLATGVAPFAKATGSPHALDSVSIEVEGRTLIVRRNVSAWGANSDQPGSPIEIRIGTHDLSSAWLNGSGSLAIDRVRGLTFGLSVQGSGSAAIGQVDVDQLSVGIGGTAGATLAGRAGKLAAVVRGISSLDASTLTSHDATIGAEGAATVKAKVTNSATVDASGPATVTLTGQPACTTHLNGSASVSGCR